MLGLNNLKIAPSLIHWPSTTAVDHIVPVTSEDQISTEVKNVLKNKFPNKK